MHEAKVVGREEIKKCLQVKTSTGNGMDDVFK